MQSFRCLTLHASTIHSAALEHDPRPSKSFYPRAGEVSAASSTTHDTPGRDGGATRNTTLRSQLCLCRVTIARLGLVVARVVDLRVFRTERNVSHKKKEGVPPIVKIPRRIFFFFFFFGPRRPHRS